MVFEIGTPGGAPSLIYHAEEHCWWLWWPCEACGGARLPLREPASVDALDRLRLPLARGIDDESCPGCETRRKRLEPAGVEPVVWYDSLLGEWVVRVPCRGLPDGALLPLGIPWFDASWAEVYRAAGDIAFGDAFEDAGRDERPGVGRDREIDG
jgi:hypothetical protein